MFWNNPKYEWVRKRKGGRWHLVQSYLDASCYQKYWINRNPFHHETIIETDVYVP
jgi:hypothetical protein